MCVTTEDSMFIVNAKGELCHDEQTTTAQHFQRLFSPPRAKRWILLYQASRAVNLFPVRKNRESTTYKRKRQLVASSICFEKHHTQRAVACRGRSPAPRMVATTRFGQHFFFFFLFHLRAPRSHSPPCSVWYAFYREGEGGSKRTRPLRVLPSVSGQNPSTPAL